MAFLTGQYPSDIDVWTNHCVLNTNVPTFAHALAAAGYEAVLCGRMHFNGPDQRHGFTGRLVGDVSPAYPGGRSADLGPIPVGSTGQSRIAVEVAGPGRSSYQVYDEHVAAACRDVLKWQASQKPSKPFAIVAGFVLPHCPFVCPKDLFDEYYDKVTLPTCPDGYFERQHPAIREWRHRRKILDLSDETIRKARAGYYGLVTHMDTLIGSIMGTLQETGLAENTIVIYTSDHGEMAGEHGMWWKSNFYEASAGVPLIVSCPSTYATGAVIRPTVSLLDLAPTLTELTGAQPLCHARGRSLLPFLTQRETGAAKPAAVTDWPDTAFCEHYTGSRAPDPPGRMVRRGPWKLNVYNGYDIPQLFNLDNDPNEWNDLGADPAHADIRQGLLGLVRDGWSPKAIERRVKRVVEDYGMLTRWGKTVRPPDPDHWVPPPGSNVFPQT
jgi:choline-sulfatase